MTTLLAITVLVSLLVACATLLVDLRRLRAGVVRPFVWRSVGVAHVVTGLLWLLYGDLALHDDATRGWFALGFGALFVLQGVRRLK